MSNFDHFQSVFCSTGRISGLAVLSDLAFVLRKSGLIKILNSYPGSKETLPIPFVKMLIWKKGSYIHKWRKEASSLTSSSSFFFFKNKISLVLMWVSVGYVHNSQCPLPPLTTYSTDSGYLPNLGLTYWILDQMEVSKAQWTSTVHSLKLIWQVLAGCSTCYMDSKTELQVSLLWMKCS